MEGKKTFQDWCVDTLLAILKSRAEYRGDDHDQGYIYVIKAIINHYASMFYCDRQMHLMRSESKEHLNLWWDHLNKKNRSEFFSRLLMSEKAQKVVCSKCSAKEAKSKLHLEHITPCGYIYNRLCNYGPKITRKDIEKVLKFDRLILLKKEEAKALDRAGAKFTCKDVDLFRHYFPAMARAEKKELSRIAPNKEHSKDSGFGLLRMAKLVNFHVNFVYADGRPCPPEKWMEYFNNPTMVITKDLK